MSARCWFATYLILKNIFSTPVYRWLLILHIAISSQYTWFWCCAQLWTYSSNFETSRQLLGLLADYSSWDLIQLLHSRFVFLTSRWLYLAVFFRIFFSTGRLFPVFSNINLSYHTWHFIYKKFLLFSPFILHHILSIINIVGQRVFMALGVCGLPPPTKMRWGCISAFSSIQWIQCCKILHWKGKKV